MTTKEESLRIHVTLPAMSLERLDALVKSTEAMGYTEVFKNALRLYEAVINETSNGNQILIRSPGGDTMIFPIFGKMGD